MNESLEELQQLAGEYVLGTMPLAQRAQIARRMADEASLRAEVAAWERRLLPLTALAEPVSPSPQLWPRIAASVRPQAAVSRSVAGTFGDAWQRWWDDLRMWRGLAASALAASVVLGTLLVLRPATTAPGAPAYMVVLVAPQDRSAGWIVQASLDRHITLTPLHGTNVPDHKALQFWTKGPGWSAPVSLGLVAPERSLKLAINSLPPLQADQLFEITLEPENGSPTGKPSGPVLYIGRAVKVI